MPFILAFKSLYCCYYFDVLTFTYFSQQFISHIPFIGSCLLPLLNEYGLLLSDYLINNHTNQFIGNLIFLGGVGASIFKSLFKLFFDLNNDTVQLPIGGDFPEKDLKRPLIEKINKLPINSMQADNTGEIGKPNSSEATSHGGGVSSTGFSLESLDKLIAERNKLLYDTKRYLEENGNSAQPAQPTQPAESSPTAPVNDNKSVIEIS